MESALDDSERLAAIFEQHEPNPSNVVDGTSLTLLASAVQARSQADDSVTSAVLASRTEGHSWAAIGAVLGVTGEAARQRYRDDDLSSVVRSLPVKKMLKAGWITEPVDARALESAVRSLSGGNAWRVAARRSNQDLDWTPEQLAWLIRAKKLAELDDAAPYKPDQLEELARSLVKQSASPDTLQQLPSLLAAAGVRLVFVEQLPGSKVDGAAFWLDERSPVIALSLRFDRIDYFMFTLAHEVAHIVRGDVKPGQPLLDEGEEFSGEMEHQANELAASWLLPVPVSELPTELSHIVGLAGELGIAPGIIVGRLHYHRLIDYSRYRSTLTRVRHLFIRN